MKLKKLYILLFLSICLATNSSKFLIPMDHNQENHLKAYGIAFWALQKKEKVEWILNYRGGSFIIDYSQNIETRCIINNVSFEQLNISTLSTIYSLVEEENMEIVHLEKAPKIAVYSPPQISPGMMRSQWY